MQPTISDSLDSTTGGCLVDARDRVLPLASASFDVQAGGGIAKVALRQEFRNVHGEPLTVTYSLPLPSDAAVGGFTFVIGDRRIVGEVDRRLAARERFEQALIEGRTAAILEQERSSLFTQEIGNIPPGTSVVAEITIDLRLRWLDEGAWELRLPTTVAPRYLGAPGRVDDAERIVQQIADGPLATRLHVHAVLNDRLPDGMRPFSSSHTLSAQKSDDGWLVTTAEEGVPLDRDVVIRWAVAALQPGASVTLCRPSDALGEHSAWGLLTVVPPAPGSDVSPIPRDLIVLLDTSGSVQGQPLEQAVRVATALVDTLGDRDSLELIAFADRVNQWKPGPVPATSDNKQAAVAWLRALRAFGGTEMRSGIEAALAGVRADAQRQVVLITDGEVGFEQEVVGAVLKKLPAGSRVHTVGVGSAVNRTLTAGVARAGRGTEVIIGIGEDAEPAVRRLVARTHAPLIDDLRVSGSALERHAPERLPDLFAGSPALIGLEIRPEGGEIIVSGRTAAGAWQQRIEIPPVERGVGSRAVARLVAREQVEDLEAQLAGGKRRGRLDQRIEELGLRFQIATRLTSWVAIDSAAAVDPGDPVRRETMPHELPYGMSVAGLGLRPAMMTSSYHTFPGAPGMASAEGSLVGAAFGALPVGALAPALLTLGWATQFGRQLAEGAASTVRQALSGKKAERASSKPSEGKEAASAARVRGRIVLRKKRQLVVEMLVEASGFVWEPELFAFVVLADGAEVHAKLGKGTRPGPVPAGASVRIVLALDADLDTQAVVRAIRVDTKSVSLYLEI
jgi:Ca-activated chloride channel family protein